MCRNAQTRMKIHGVYHMTNKNNKYLHMKHKFILIVYLLVYPFVFYSQTQNQADSILLAQIKTQPECQNDWLSFRKMLLKSYFQVGKDTILKEIEIFKNNESSEVRLSNLKNSTVTFYYLTPATDDNTDEDMRSRISVSLYEDNFMKEVFKSDDVKVQLFKYSKFTVHRYTLDFKEDIKKRKDILLKQNYRGTWFIVQNKNPKYLTINQTYFPPNIPKEEVVNKDETNQNTKSKKTCTECNGKGTTVQEVAVNCAKCYGKGTISCSTCGGGGRLYTKDRSRSEYCYKCSGSGKSNCFSCNGSGKKYSSLPKKCPVCNGKKTIDIN